MARKIVKPDTSHTTGFRAMSSYDGDGVVCQLRVDNKTLYDHPVAKDIDKDSHAGHLELARILCHCLNAGIDPQSLLLTVANTLAMSKDHGIIVDPKFRPDGIQVVSPVVVRYLFSAVSGTDRLEVAPDYRTRRLEAPKNDAVRPRPSDAKIADVPVKSDTKNSRKNSSVPRKNVSRKNSTNKP